MSHPGRLAARSGKVDENCVAVVQSTHVDERSATVDSLDLVELGMVLEDLGVRFNEGQWDRLKPHLVPVRSTEMSGGQARSRTSVFAQRGLAVLAIDETVSKLAVGKLNERNQVVGSQRFASPELAVRTFLSL